MNRLSFSMAWEEETIRKEVTFPILRNRPPEAKYPLYTNRLRIGKLGKSLYIRTKDLPNPRCVVQREEKGVETVSRFTKAGTILGPIRHEKRTGTPSPPPPRPLRRKQDED
jgi:hypothetical protein